VYGALSGSGIKLKFHGTDTNTDIIGVRLSCNFVDVYTIIYRGTVHVYTRASLTDILARILARK